MNGAQQHNGHYMLETTLSAQTSLPPHTHCAKVDQQGNGITSIDLNHQHTVVKGVAQVSTDGHMHGMTNSMCVHNSTRSFGKAGCSGCMKR